MQVRKQIVFALLFILGISSDSFSEDVFWKEVKGDHFIVYYLGQDEFATNVSHKAEEYYSKISSDLGYQRYSNFWQWENRVKIYIYQTREEFLKRTGSQNWSHGYANYENKEIGSYVWETGFLEALLPHEITHLIFRDYVGLQGHVPIWLDEGVAQWEEPEKRAIVRQVMRDYLKAEKVFAFKDLMNLDIRNVSFAPSVQLFYVEAISIVDFLVSEFGADGFIFFCRQLRDGKAMDEALRFAYPTEIRDIKQMEEKWKDYILSTP